MCRKTVSLSAENSVAFSIIMPLMETSHKDTKAQRFSWRVFGYLQHYILSLRLCALSLLGGFVPLCDSSATVNIARLAKTVSLSAEKELSIDPIAQEGKMVTSGPKTSLLAQIRVNANRDEKAGGK